MSHIFRPTGHPASVAAQIRNNKRPSYRSSFQHRTLGFEGLEARYALSAVAGSDVATCPAVDGQSAEGESAFTSSAPLVTSDSAALEADFVGPLEIDAYFLSLSTTEVTSIDAEGEEGAQPNAAPTLMTLSAVRNGDYWVLSGTVADDQNPTYCRVYFDGIANGESAAVMSNGTFWHYIPYIPGYTTIVSAVARDAEGAESNIMTVILH